MLNISDIKTFLNHNSRLVFSYYASWFNNSLPRLKKHYLMNCKILIFRGQNIKLPLKYFCASPILKILINAANILLLWYDTSGIEQHKLRMNTFMSEMSLSNQLRELR